VQALATQGALHLGLGGSGRAAQRRQVGAQRQLGFDQLGVAFPQPGKGVQRDAGGEQVAADPVAAAIAVVLAVTVDHRRECGQPQVERAVERDVVEHRQRRRQRQHVGFEPRQRRMRAAAGHTLQPAARAADTAVGGAGQAHRAGTSAGAKQQADAALHLRQADRRLRVLAVGGAADETMPLLADPLFHQSFS